LTPYPASTYNLSVSKIRIVPAILTDDPKKLASMVKHIEGFARYAQFDIMDGQFVPSRSITAEDIARLNTELGWEAHLMTLHPEDYLEAFKQAGAEKIIFHYEATPAPRGVIAKARKSGLKVGLAANPQTPVATITPLAGEVDSVLFLSVNPGFYGSRFLPEVLDKLAAFHKACPDIEVGIDGGINEDNIARVVRSGVANIYIGSAISMQPQPATSYRRLLALAEAEAAR